jgi:hypothetical protein
MFFKNDLDFTNISLKDGEKRISEPFLCRFSIKIASG